MPEPNLPTTDPTWRDFHDSEQRQGEMLEADFRDVAARNALVLNMVAGLEELKGTDSEVIQDGVDAPPTGQGLTRQFKAPLSARLHLRPDYRQKLKADGDPDFETNGNPDIIFGELPKRTQQLIDNLIDSIQAVPVNTDQHQSDEVWRGKVAGVQDIDLVFQHQMVRATDGSDRQIPRLSLLAQRVFDDSQGLPQL